MTVPIGLLILVSLATLVIGLYVGYITGKKNRID